VTELSDGLERRLAEVGLDPAVVKRVIRTALAEDLTGGSDVTTAATIPASAIGQADIVARSPGVVAGLLVAEAVFELACGSDGSAVSVQESAASIVPEGRSHRTGAALKTVTTHNSSDGDTVRAGQILMTVEGNVADILTAERTALNLLCHMSGVASVTRQWVDAAAGTRARVRDTRKTLPGLRALEKYAVRCGGADQGQSCGCGRLGDGSVRGCAAAGA
jgi:nicotinate-nucleotide pyrophosphorylase (carboxylating)